MYPAICKRLPTIPKNQLGMIIFTILEVDFKHGTIQILKSQLIPITGTFHLPNTPFFFLLTELQILKTMH